MPYVRRKTDDILVRLDVFYKQILALKFGIGVGEDGSILRPNEQQENLAKEVFGDRIIDAAPSKWHYAEAFLAAEKFPHEWFDIPIHSRAEWLAAKRIKGMVDVLERYREVIDRHNREEKARRRKPPTHRK